MTLHPQNKRGDLIKSVILQSLSRPEPQRGESDSGKLLTVNQVKLLFDISKTTLWRWMKAGKLKPVRLSRKKILFRNSDIIELIESLIKE